MIVSLSRYFSCSSTKPGISALHGPHQVAQKFSSTTLLGSLNDASETSLPSMSFNLKSHWAGFASAMHDALSAVLSCDAAGVTATGADSACAPSSFGDHTNGIAIASSAIAVTAMATLRILPGAGDGGVVGVSPKVFGWSCWSITLFCLIPEIRRHA